LGECYDFEFIRFTINFSRLQFVQIKKILVEHLLRIQNPNSCGNAYSANSFPNAACKTKWRFVQHPIDQIINKNM